MHLCCYTPSICEEKQYTAERTKHKCVSVTSYQTYCTLFQLSYGISAKKNSIFEIKAV